MIRFILFFVLVFGILFIGIRYLERQSIYFPMRRIESTPSVVGLDYEEIFFNTSDGVKLCGWFMPSGVKDSQVMLFCHGNAGNISHRLEKIRMFHDLGLNVFIFDYRGYGKSEGAPTEDGLYKDAKAAFDYIVSKGDFQEGDVIFYGESIGGAVVIDLATKVEPKAIITEELFSSAKDMTRIAYPFLPHFIFASRFDSVSKIKDIRVPKLIIHSPDDEIAPYAQGQKLFQAAAPPKEFLKIRGSHNTAFLESEKEFTGGIKKFVDKLR